MFNIILSQLRKLTQYLTRSPRKTRKKSRTNPKTIDNLYKMKNNLGEPQEGTRRGTLTLKVTPDIDKAEKDKVPNPNKGTKETKVPNTYTGEKCIRHPYKLRKYIQARRRREKK